MTRQLTLFAPVGAATPDAETTRLGEALPDGLYLGTSSWSFPGWKGFVYDRDVGTSTLARHGLAAYAQHPLFRSVCIDRTYYAPIPAADFADYASAVPDDFRFVVKAHEALTRERPKDDPTTPNPLFLDPSYANDEVVGPCLEGLGAKAGVILFQLPPQRIDAPARWAERIARMLGELPPSVDYALELRNPELLTDAYTEMLAATGASHCYNVHPTMPDVSEQARRIPPGSFESVVVRWMLRRHLTYGDAKEAFYPFDAIRDRDDGSRDGIASLCRGAKRAYVVVNNKAEGCAPKSLARLAEQITRSTAV